MKRQMLQMTLGVCALLSFAGCWFGNDKESTSSSTSTASSGEPLICFGTRTVLTVEDFNKKLNMLQESQPGLETMLASMPETEQLNVYQRFAEGCVAESLIREDVKARGLDATAEFKEMAKQAHDALDGQLSLQAFQNDVIREIEAVVEKMTDAELRTYYEDHRDKDAIFQRAPFVKGSGKEDKETKKAFVPFEEVRDSIKQVIKQERIGNAYQTKLEELKKQYGVKVEAACLNRFVVKKDDSQKSSQFGQLPVNGATPSQVPAAPNAA